MTGAKEWSAIKLGESAISAVYRGAVLVWISVAKIWRRKDIWKRKEQW